MGLDISKIQNAELKKLAYKADNDNNGFLDAKEVSIFKEEALAKEGVSADDFNQAMGLYKSVAATETEAKTVTETEAPAEETKVEATAPKEETKAPAKVSNQDRNVFEANMTNFIKNMVKNGSTPEELLSALEEKYNSGFYKSVADDIKAVIKAVQATNYDSKEDVDNIKKSVKKNMKSFQKDLLDEIIKAAESDQIKKEAAELVEIYKDVEKDKSLYAENKLGESVLNLTECEKAVKKELAKRGKKKESYYSGKAMDLLKKHIKEDASAIHDAKVVDTEGEKRKTVKKEVMETNASGDKYAKKTTRKKKTEQEIAAAHNKYEHNLIKLEKVRTQEIKDELGEDIYAKLAASYLSDDIKNEDGTFNITSLAKGVFYRVGYDYEMNQSNDTQMSELRNVQAELKALTGQDFTDTEAKKIVKYCAIKIERNSHNPFKKTKEAITGAITAGIAAFNSSPVLNVNQSIRITVDLGMSSGIIESLGDLADVAEVGDGKLLISINQSQILNTRLLDTLAGAGLGVLGATLLQMIFGEGKEFEKSCISIADFDFSNPRYTNFDEYEKYVKSRYPEAKANAVIALAKLCADENGKFDPAKFDSMLKHIAGVGSNINCKEVTGGRLYADAPEAPAPVEDTPTTETTTKVTPQTEGSKCVLRMEKVVTEGTEIIEELTMLHERKFGDSWEGLVEAYYPGLVEKCGGRMYGNKGAIRALKEALAKGDKNKLNELINDTNLREHIYLPKSIKGIERQDDGIVKKVKVHGNGKSSGKVAGEKDIKITKIPGTDTYFAKDGCDGTTASGSTEAEAQENLEKTTGKKYTTVIKDYETVKE